jgi:cysteine synthase
MTRINSFSILSVKGSASSFEQAVGNTRLVRLKTASEYTGCDIYGKCEWENPGGSVKDRAALWMLRDAEKSNILKPGTKGLIVEGTAGNTGIGLALAGKAHGYDVLICLANSQSPEKKDALRQAGAILVEVPAVPFKNPNNYVHVAERMALALLAEDSVERNPYGKHIFYANQWDNLANRQAHIESTGPEIWTQCGGKIDAFSCAVGTGGTLSGVGEFLRTVDPHVKIALTDPEGAAVMRYFTEGKLKAHGSSITEGIGQGRITGNLGNGNFRPDLFFEIPDIDMLPIMHELQSKEGLAVGGSAAVNVTGAIEVAKQLGPGHVVVTMLCDRADRYATKLYNKEFLNSVGLPVPKWIEYTEEKTEMFQDILQMALE